MDSESENKEPMDIKDVTDITVDIIMPKKWYLKPTYRLRFSYKVDDDIVEEGFVSDGASVPRFMWFIFPAVNRYFLPAVLHDYKLKKGHGWKRSNNAFKSAMKQIKINYTVTVIFTAFVRAYGFYRVLTRGDKP